MSLADEVFKYAASGYAATWVRTWEPEDAIREIREMCEQYGFLFYQHNPKDGIQKAREATRDNRAKWEPLQIAKEVNGKPVPLPTKSFDEALRAIIGERAIRTVEHNKAQASVGTDDPPPNMILAVWHAHLYGEGLVEDIREVMNIGEEQRLHLVFMSHIIKPIELLRPRMAFVEHDLPSREQLTAIANDVATEENDIPDRETFNATIAAASGMTRTEAKNAFSLSLHEYSQLVPDAIWQMKAQMLKTGNQALVLSTAQEPAGFEDVGGWMAAKAYHMSMLNAGARKPIKARPRGSLLLGVPGGGKDWYIEALGKETHRPVLQLHLGRTRGGIQGQTEQWTDEVFRKADRMAPCILSISEIEKLFSGLKSSGLTDGGVKSNQIGAFLNWMQTRTADVYLMASCNNIQAIVSEMPEFVRAQRFDRIFYVDFPCKPAQEQIWKIHLRAYGHLMNFGVQPKHLSPPGTNVATAEEIDAAFKQVVLPDYQRWKRWTGAEIEACCAEADLRDIPLAECEPSSMDDIAPDVIRETQEWATGKTYGVDYSGKYLGPDIHAEMVMKAFGTGNGNGHGRTVTRKGKPSRN